MACLYTYKVGPTEVTFTKEELIEYLKNNPKSNTYEVKPDFSNIDEILKTIPSNQKTFVQSGIVPMQISNLESLQVGEKRATIRQVAYKDGIYEFDGKKYKITSKKSNEQGIAQKVNISEFKSPKFLKNIFKRDYKEGLHGHVDAFFSGKQDLYVYMIERIDNDIINEYVGEQETFEEPESTEKKELSNRVITRLNKLLKEQGDKIKARILVFESAKERKGYLPKEETINKLKDLKEQLSTLENTEAFFKTAEFIHNELSVTQQFLDNKFDITNHDHINYLLQISNQLDSYGDLRTFLPQMSGLNSDIAKIGSEIDSMYADINDEINEILQAYMVDFVSSDTKQSLTTDDILDMFKEAKDISIQELKMGGMSNSVNPLLQLLHKRVETKREEIYENTNTWKEKINAAGEKLKKAGVEGFTWMYQHTKEGKLTGRLLHKVSHTYYEAEKKIYELLEDSEGNKREYVYKPGETLSQAEKDHNIALSRDKAKLGEFLNAETTGEQGLQDGENRKFTDEFKQARSEFEYYGMGEKGYNEWLKKPFIPGSKLSTGEELTPAIHEKLYKQYKRKYYQDERESFSMVKDQLGRPTGVVKRTLVTFVKPEFTEVVTERNGKPTKFGNPEYYKVMNDQTPQGKAKREYFEFALKANEEILDKLPLSTAQKMQGKMFRIKSSLINDIKKLGVLNYVKKSFRQFVNPDVVFSSRELDENGQLLADVPIMYTTDLKNTEKLKKLEAKLKSLQEALLKDPSNKELHSKIKIAKNVINIEENKLTPEELELDMTKSLIKAAHMAENYDLMKQVESTLMIARKIMKNTKFFKLDSAGQKEFLHENEKSKTEERFDTYMRMIFYSK